MLSRPIPVSGESLPLIGCGTWQAFDVPPLEAPSGPLAGVVQALVEGGGRVVDSSPMYGRAEAVVGALLAGDDLRRRCFLATKVWTRGREEGIRQMEASLSLLRTRTIDLMQVHNLLDWRVHMPVLREWRAEGRIRYIGITHYTPSAHVDLAAVMRAARPDFVQFNYSLGDRAAEARLLPLAADLGIAVLVNLPLGEGRLLRRLASEPLPDWVATLGCASWAQLLLKYVISHPAVTCAIPGTGKPAHMADNLAAASGALLDSSQRLELAHWWDGRQG